MPSRGEGFGFVFLEALACGVPVIASRLDGGREAVRDGALGQLVDPTNPAEIRQAVIDALAAGGKQIPEGLAYFSYENFERRTHAIIDALAVNG
jgi:glycosyltransferase involved in cell wall biosynthesis